MQTPDYTNFVNNLTVRERQILALVVEGLMNKEIAIRLNRSEGTIKKHREHILQKAGVNGTSNIRKFMNEIKPFLL
jgi:DNA-binding NarL/FixJ family response regulator